MTAETANLTINGLSHGGVTVTDMERSLRFYRDGLGLEVYIDRIANHDYLREVTAVPSTEVRIVYLRVPGSRVPIELLEHRGIERVPSRARPCDPGSVHLGLQVEDIDAFHERMVSLGFPSIRPPGEHHGGPIRWRPDVLLPRPRRVPHRAAAAARRQA